MTDIQIKLLSGEIRKFSTGFAFAVDENFLFISDNIRIPILFGTQRNILEYKLVGPTQTSDFELLKRLVFFTGAKNPDFRREIWP